MDEDHRRMQRALALAERGLGRVEPNPMVGAVIVRDDGAVLGEGWHETFGADHAEAAALNDCREAGYDPAGACVYVNLEPCTHHGKQPPCVDALIAAKVRRLVVAMTDPDPRVQGRGLAALRDAGIEVITDVEHDAAAWLNRGFIKRTTAGRPWVIAKWAQSLDGRIAAGGGESQWLSGEAARRRVHQWRGQVDAILVGPTTFEHDNPRLTARDAEPRRPARRVVIAPPLESLRQSAMLTEPGPPVTLAVRESEAAAVQRVIDEQAACEVEVITLTNEAGDVSGGAGARLSLTSLMQHLATVHEATNVLVEGGGGLMGALWREALVDELRVFISPRVMGDDRAISAVRGLRCATIAEAEKLAPMSVEQLADDLLLTYRVR